MLRRGQVANTAAELAHAVGASGGAAKAVLEATGNWGYEDELLEPWVAEVRLAHPLRVKAIASAKGETERVEADTLARLLRADLIPAVYVPPREVRDQRDWLGSRVAVVWTATQLTNRIHALRAKKGLSSPASELFGKRGRAWLATLELRPCTGRA